jgi:uroporphyrinogen-III synthase
MHEATVIVTRPEPDASDFAQALADRGFRPIVFPLMEIWARGAADLPAGAVVAFTSANGARSIRAAPSGLAFAIGPATAAAARAAGWVEVVASDADSDKLADEIAAAYARGRFQRPVTHIAGSHRAGDLVARLAARGVPAERRISYEAIAADALSADVKAALRAPGPVVASFFSPRTAAIFTSLSAGPDDAAALANVDAVCLSKAVAASLADGAWRSIHVSEASSADAMIAAISRLAARSDP